MLSRALLRSFVRSYVDESRRLAAAQLDSRGSFAQEDIARRVFPGRRSATAMLSRVVGPRGNAAATAGMARRLADECRSLLDAQHRALGTRNPQQAVATFEKATCDRLGIRWQNSLDCDSLLLHRRIEGAKTLADWGLPDVMGWRDAMFGPSLDLPAILDLSYDVIREIAAHIPDQAPQRKIELSRMAASIAGLNYPGSPHHANVYELALQAGSQAGLLHLSRSWRVNTSLQREASEQLFQLNSAPFTPTLDSPYNFTAHVMSGVPLSPQRWAAVESDVDRVIGNAIDMVRIDPSPWSFRLRCSAYSMKARLLLAVGGPGAVRQADWCHDLSIRDLDRIGHPYGFAYPVLRAAALTDYSAALSCCEHAIDTFRRSMLTQSANAFAALYVQLMDKRSPGTLPDEQVVQMARSAVTDPSTRYQCSHVFEASVVAQLVRLRKRRRRTR